VPSVFARPASQKQLTPQLQVAGWNTTPRAFTPWPATGRKRRIFVLIKARNDRSEA
jgi:hypothetical protein